MDIIIGAGVTGLSYASFTKNDYLILEGSSEIGGYCKTIKQDGFTWDYSGHFFHFKNKEIKEFVFSHMKEQKIYDVNKKTQIFFEDRYIDFPFQKNIHQLPKQEFIDCLYDLYNRNENNVSTFKDMLLSKFGRSISDKFLIPYNEKLYACSLDKLDKDAMGRFFPYADIEEIINNFKAAHVESYNNNFVYPEGGAIEYINAIASTLNKEKIKLNTKVVEIDKVNKTVLTSDGETFKYENLINTMPFNKLLPMVNLDENIDVYTSNKVAVFNLGFDLPSTTDNHWIYYPSKDLCFYRAGFYNNIFGSDKMSLYVEIGLDSKENQVCEAELLENVLIDLKKVGIVSEHKLLSYKYIMMNPAYVHVNKKSEGDLKDKMLQLNKLNIFSAGRYGAWKYCSIEDNIIEAKLLAQTITSSK